MKSMVVWCLAAGMMVASVSLASAADDAVKGKGKKGQAGGQNAQVFKLPDTIQLTADQEEKLSALKKEYGPKVAELQKKADGILTAEQKTARKDAMAKVKADNLKGKARQEAIDSALNLTADQQEKLKAVQAEQKELNGKIKDKIAGFLTEEQKAKLPAPQKKGKKNKAA